MKHSSDNKSQFTKSNYIFNTHYLLVVAVERKPNEWQMVAGVSFWNWECLFWCVIIRDVVKVFCVGITFKLWKDWRNSWNSTTQ